ncbi:MAG TPA: NAD-glutamate dehydrogenase, partial [Phenylobacterium sp.]|nr:NAD-glutamate dehydrogenase [Phenylobacterium sp.]
DQAAERLTKAGAPAELARAVVDLQPLTIAADLADLAEASEWPVDCVARIHHAAAEAFGFDRLRAAAGGHAAGDSFERAATRRLVEDLMVEQTTVAKAVMALARAPKAGQDKAAARRAVEAWAKTAAQRGGAARRVIGEIEAAPGPWTFAKLTIASGALRELVRAAD